MKLPIYFALSIPIWLSGFWGNFTNSYWNFWDLAGLFALMLFTILTAYEWFVGKAKSFFSLKRGRDYIVLSSHVQRFNDPDVVARNYIYISVDGEIKSFYVGMYEVCGSFGDRIEPGHTIQWDYVNDTCPFTKKKSIFIVTPKPVSGGGVILA